MATTETKILEDIQKNSVVFEYRDCFGKRLFQCR